MIFFSFLRATKRIKGQLLIAFKILGRRNSMRDGEIRTCWGLLVIGKKGAYRDREGGGPALRIDMWVCPDWERWSSSGNKNDKKKHTQTHFDASKRGTIINAEFFSSDINAGTCRSAEEGRGPAANSHRIWATNGIEHDNCAWITKENEKICCCFIESASFEEEGKPTGENNQPTNEVCVVHV